MGMRTVALLGRGGGDARALAEHAIVVPSDDTQRVQEVHSFLVHLLCELVEERVFGGRILTAVASAASETTVSRTKRPAIAGTGTDGVGAAASTPWLADRR